MSEIRVPAFLARPECAALRRVIEKLCLNGKFKYEVLENRTVAKAAAKYVRLLLVPAGSAGAPRKEQLDRAEGLVRAGATWKKIWIEMKIRSGADKVRIRSALKRREKRAKTKREQIDSVHANISNSDSFI